MNQIISRYFAFGCMILNAVFVEILQCVGLKTLRRLFSTTLQPKIFKHENQTFSSYRENRDQKQGANEQNNVFFFRLYYWIIACRFLKTIFGQKQ